MYALSGVFLISLCEQARHISEAAREAAERIYLAHGTSASMEVKSTWNESAKSIDALAVVSEPLIPLSPLSGGSVTFIYL